MNRAFFLDRDGVINEEVNYLHEAEKTVLIPGVPEAVQRIHAAGFLAVAVTNQAGVAKGFYPLSHIVSVHARIQRLLLRSGADAVIDAWYFCPHHPEFTGECSCRKPRPGMLLRAAADFDIDLSRSFMIGDRISDLLAGRGAGCRASMLVLSGYGVNETEKARNEGFDFSENLLEAVKKLLA